MRGIAAERERLGAFELGLDDPAEDDAAHAELTAYPDRLAGRLARRSRGVDLPFARDDEIRTGDRLAEADPPQHLRRPAHEVGAERCQGGAEAARRPRARQIGERCQVRSLAEAALEQPDLLRR